MKNTTLGLFGLLFLSLPAFSQSNLLSNANFEEWGLRSLLPDADSIPLDWSGSATNLYYPDVSRTTDSFSGLYACRIIHTQKSFSRFSSSPVYLKAGAYTLQFFAKGDGILRNGYYNGASYSTYSSPDTLSSVSWKKIQYYFTLKNSEPLPIQLIFSVSQTAPSGIVIDNASLISHTITDVQTPLIPQYYIDGSCLHVSLPFSSVISVYNLFGTLVYTSENTSFSIPLSSGIYLVVCSGKSFKIKMN